MTRTGLSRIDGSVLTGWDHCAQSLTDIVSTLVGERVEARAYGYDGPPVQDRPGNEPEIVRHFSRLAQAISLWEPGYRLVRVLVDRLDSGGVAGFRLTGNYYPYGHLGDYSVVETGRDVLVPLRSGGALS